MIEKHEKHMPYIDPKAPISGDSIRALFIPYLEVTNKLWRGHAFTIPKKVTKNCEV